MMNYNKIFEKEQEIMKLAETFYKNGYFSIIPSLVDEAFFNTLHEHAWYLTNYHKEYSLFDNDFVEYVNNLWLKFELAKF